MNIFTKDEKKALIFLVACLFLGTAILYCKAIFPKETENIEFTENIQNFSKININNATETELIKLKNIGPALAGRIISYRALHGPFIRKEDIKNVKGIGDKKYSSIENQIDVE